MRSMTSPPSNGLAGIVWGSKRFSKWQPVPKSVWNSSGDRKLRSMCGRRVSVPLAMLSRLPSVAYAPLAYIAALGHKP